MKDLQILVASMGQTDFSLVQRMNIRCDAVIANQADINDFSSAEFQWGTVKMISTDTVGVGINRNIAMLAADAEILLFADDDVVYNDDAPEQIKKAFEENPKADVIIFGIDYSEHGDIVRRRHLRDKRLHLWNSLRYGTCVLAIRRKALLISNISFSLCFGGGCIYSSGEDSLFIRDCFKSGLKVYSHSYVLGVNSKDSSTWFTGCNEKYFYDKGALLRLLFPHTYAAMLLRFAFIFKKPTKISAVKRLQLMIKGSRGVKKMIPYLSEK